MESKITAEVFPAKAMRPCRHLIKDGAEGEQVGAGIEFLAAGLFGRHVGDRAYGRSRAGQVLFDRCAFGGGRLRARQLRQSEVEDFGLTAFRNEDVGRLDVAMDNFFGVRGVERVGDLDGQGEQGLGVHGWPEMRCFRVTPSRNSMAMKAWPSCSPMS